MCLLSNLSGVAFQDSPVSVFTIRTLSTNPTNYFWGIFVVLLVRLRLVWDSTIPLRPKLSLSHPGVKIPAVWDTWRKGVRAGRKSALQTRFYKRKTHSAACVREDSKMSSDCKVVIPAAVEREPCSSKCWHLYTLNNVNGNLSFVFEMLPCLGVYHSIQSVFCNCVTRCRKNFVLRVWSILFCFQSLML